MKGHISDPVLTLEPQLQWEDEEFNHIELPEKQVCPSEDKVLKVGNVSWICNYDLVWVDLVCDVLYIW